MSEAAPKQRHETNDQEVDVDEAEDIRTVNGLIYDKVYAGAEKFAGTYAGQYVTGRVDRILKLIEDTARWSLPQSQDKNESSIPLERPLPWIPFIAMILMLRMVRVSLSIGGLLIGNAPLKPGDVVYFIQTRRRKLRAIRLVGMREIRRSEQAQSANQGTGIASRLRSLLRVVVCRPGQGREAPYTSGGDRSSTEVARTPGDNETKVPDSTSKRRRDEDDDETSDHELTLDQIIDKYGGASSDNDSDFIPKKDAFNDGDTSSQSTSSASSEDDDDEDKDEPVNEESNQSREDANPESDAHMTNGNRREKITPNTTEIGADENSAVIVENGLEHINEAPRRPAPVPMPKPQKKETIPKPISEIKQEPVDSEEERPPNSPPDAAELKRSNELAQHQQQQSVVAQCDVKVNDEIIEKTQDNGDDDAVNPGPDNRVNGDESLMDHKSEVFLTPATSAEDLFYSPVGSPSLTGDFGFQPTSILKNVSAVHKEKRGPDVPYQEEESVSKAETTNALQTSQPISTSQIPTRGSSNYTARNNKTKFRGKRR